MASPKPMTTDEMDARYPGMAAGLSGRTDTEIAAEYGISRQRVAAIRRRLGTPKPPGRPVQPPPGDCPLRSRMLWDLRDLWMRTTGSTSAAFAEAMGTSQSQISAFTRGRKAPAWEMLVQAAGLMGLVVTMSTERIDIRRHNGTGALSYTSRHCW